MNKSKIIIVLLTVLGISLANTGCVNKSYEDPEAPCSKEKFNNTQNIMSLKSMFTGDTVEIKEDIVVEAYVTSSDQDGNFYKELVIEDSTDAISIMIDAGYMYTRYPVGQKIYIKCKGLLLGKSYGVVKLGSTYLENGFVSFGRIQGEAIIDQHIIKSCDNKAIEPQVITLNDIGPKYLNKLVKIENVQFKTSELDMTWANAQSKESGDRHIVDKDNKSLLVRTSGYAKFAGSKLPQKNGSITGILSKYNSDYQLLVRSTRDVSMANERFVEPIFKDFEDEDINSGGWKVNTVKGDEWIVASHNSNFYANASNYHSGGGAQHVETETWLISPELTLTSYAKPFLSFKNACKYSGDILKVRYSTDYDGTSAPSSANWTELSPTLSSGYFNWVSSGKLSLPKNAKYVAFIYYGSSSSGKTWEVDNILIDNDK